MSSAEDYKTQDMESTISHQLDRPYTTLVIGIVVFLMLLFLALKAGFSLWLMAKLGFGERLVNGRGEPDFWSVTKTLDTYQRPDGNAQQQVKEGTAAVGKKEMFGGRRERLVDPRLLAAAL